MIILFGSYARGEHVLWDERSDFGTHTTFQSDLDILVVLSKGDVVIAERRLIEKVGDKYEKIIKAVRQPSPDSVVQHYATPEFLAEYVGTLNKELETSRYFFAEIVKDGIMLYNSKEFKLAKPRDLLYKEIKKIAVEEYGVKFKFRNGFLETGFFNYKKEWYVLGSFQLHQACERYLNAIELVFTNYKPKSHNLKILLGEVKKHSRDLVAVFPINTDFEKRCYNLICRAYIEARYNSKFVVTKEELEYMLERAEILKVITECICTDKIKSYDFLIAEQETCIEACP